MTKFGDLLAAAVTDQLTRGQVFWIANNDWQLRLYAGAKSHDHPGLVCFARPTVAPGTSDPRAGRRNFGDAFALTHPEVLNERPSTFFIALRKYVPKRCFGHFMGRIHEDDLRRLNKALDLHNETRNGTN